MKDINNYGTETRRWLLSVIRQRKFLLELGKSKAVNRGGMMVALARLELYLGLYSYANPFFMARFVNQHKDEISILLPGKGSSMYEKRQREFEQICSEASMIMAGKQMQLSYGSI